jgi:Methyltransferase FkbM domain
MCFCGARTRGSASESKAKATRHNRVVLQCSRVEVVAFIDRLPGKEQHSLNNQMLPRHRVGLIYFVGGVFVGFVLSSFLSSVSLIERSTINGNSVISGDLRPIFREESPSSFKKENGWSLIHVYFGNLSHIADNSNIPNDYFSEVQWFSQVRQDEVVSLLLKGKRNGYFIDLASNDAVKISNTYALERYFGWNGLCVEPNPRYWDGLSYRKCDVVGAVIGAFTMEEVRFKYPNRAGAQGGIVGAQFNNKNPSKFNEDHLRYTVTLLDVFERFRTPKVIDYLSLDVEGAEEFIMQTFPFSQYRFNILTVERPSDTLKSLLATNGYVFLKLLKQNSGETLWAHKLHLESLDMRALELDTENYNYRDSHTSVYMNRPVF